MALWPLTSNHTHPPTKVMIKASKHSISIPLTDKQHDLFRRIAKADRRKLDDLYRLIFACGLEFYWCEDTFSFKKRDDELTNEERKQIAKNKEIKKGLRKTEGKELYELSDEEEKKLGYKEVYIYHRGGGYSFNEKHPNLCHVLSEEIREPLLDKEED